MTMLFLAALFGHFIGDYPFQSAFIADFKGRFDYILFCHAAIWTGCIAVPLAVLGVLVPWKIAFLLAGHFAIDRWKARKLDKTHALTRDLWIDQALHVAQIAVVCLA